MSRLPGERAPVSALSSASLASSGGARDARPRAPHRSQGQRRRVLGVQAFLNTKRVARNSGALSAFCKLALCKTLASKQNEGYIRREATGDLCERAQSPLSGF